MCGGEGFIYPIVGVVSFRYSPTYMYYTVLYCKIGEEVFLKNRNTPDAVMGYHSNYFFSFGRGGLYDTRYRYQSNQIRSN